MFYGKETGVTLGNMNAIYKACLVFFASAILVPAFSIAQVQSEDIVQINGVIMTPDSLRAVSDATVLVKNKNRGVESSPMGVFSIVALKGDTLLFSCVGFRTVEYPIPANISGHYFSLIQLMVQDTFFLPETIIRPLPSKEQFDYAFKHWKIPDDKYETARKNTNALMLRALAYSLPRDGRENQAAYQQIQTQAAVYYGQQKPMNVFSPMAWAEFFEAWKRGDFRKKNKF